MTCELQTLWFVHVIYNITILCVYICTIYNITLYNVHKSSQLDKMHPSSLLHQAEIMYQMGDFESALVVIHIRIVVVLYCTIGVLL